MTVFVLPCVVVALASALATTTDFDDDDGPKFSRVVVEFLFGYLRSDGPPRHIPPLMSQQNLCLLDIIRAVGFATNATRVAPTTVVDAHIILFTTTTTKIHLFL